MPAKAGIQTLEIPGFRLAPGIASLAGMTDRISCELRKHHFLSLASCLLLRNHPIRSRQHVGRNGEIDLFSCFEVDYQLEFRRLLDGKVAGLSAH